MTPTAPLIALIAGLATAMTAVPVIAETSASSRSRAAIFENQARLLDGRLSEQYQFSARLRPEVEVEIIPSFRGNYAGPYLAVARAAADRNGIPQDLFLRLVQQESGWNVDAVSNKGAIGLAQLMPGTASDLGVDPTDPTANLDGGARYLATQYRRFGNWRLALAAYNAGPEAVAQHNDVPPFAETQDYVRRILGR